MRAKSGPAANLQHELLVAAIKDHRSRLRFSKSSAETLATTYAALLSLQRKKLIEPRRRAILRS